VLKGGVSHPRPDREVGWVAGAVGQQADGGTLILTMVTLITMIYLIMNTISWISFFCHLLPRCALNQDALVILP
jgi:hypothetical protein